MILGAVRAITPIKPVGTVGAVTPITPVMAMGDVRDKGLTD